ncbi:nucleoside hydrolase [Brachybacterium sp. GCM10030252]|uniref:nucleoside hydrolase n=1 Tax=Brachybacterium sp. GCM10030252 TaxID=3273380 RepID=UPI0036234499
MELRARLVAKVFASAGRAAPIIAAGLAETRSGKPAWWAGHEGSTIEDLDEQEFAENVSAVDVLAAGGHVVPIGPLTNVAAALEHPRCAIREITMMGGAFDGRTDHNIRSDVDAARVVFDAGVELTAVGLEITEQVRLTEADLTGLDGELGQLLLGEVHRYWSVIGHDWNTPHDPIAVLTMVAPELFRFERGRIRIDGADGCTDFDPDPDGPHRIVRALDIEGVRHELVTRLGRACTR